MKADKTPTLKILNEQVSKLLHQYGSDAVIMAVVEFLERSHDALKNDASEQARLFAQRDYNQAQILLEAVWPVLEWESIWSDFYSSIHDNARKGL